jgi:hypothetical protein
MQPSGQPSMQPSSQPSTLPSSQPTSKPSMQPSSQPSRQPSCQPTSMPSTPSGQPSMQPSCQPTSKPSTPSGQPSTLPSSQPSSKPSRQPSGQPSSQPSRRPSGIHYTFDILRIITVENIVITSNLSSMIFNDDSWPCGLDFISTVNFYNLIIFINDDPFIERNLEFSSQLQFNYYDNLYLSMLSNTNVITCFIYDHYCYLYHHRNNRYSNLLNIFIITQGQPSMQPSSKPSPRYEPSSQPSSQPTSQPSRQPSGMTYIYNALRVITDMNTLMILNVVAILFFHN